MIRVYFAGSMRGGRADAALYARLIARIGRTCRVLTEHVGSAAPVPPGERGMTDEEIYRQDMAWLRACDLVIAECTTPSLGVGYELAVAEKLGKPAHVFYDEGRCSLSAMLTGDAAFRLHPYRTEAELLAALDVVLAGAAELPEPEGGFRPGDTVQHFKRTLLTPEERAAEPELYRYEVVGTAEHTESGEKLMIYRPRYGEKKLFARPLAMFCSPVDRAKYPNTPQRRRFETV